MAEAARTNLDHDLAAVAAIEDVPEILKAITHLTGMRLAAVARVTDSRWLACAVEDGIGLGLKAGVELSLESTLCHQVRLSGQPIMYPSGGTRGQAGSGSGSPLPPVESCVSVPIRRRDGSFFGTLCAVDPLPARLDEPTLAMLQLFARLIATRLDLEERLASSDSALSDSRDEGKLRERFIAVLGHDLRNPLQAISMASEMMLLERPAPRQQRNIERIQESVERISDLVQDVLDFARGRMGGGIPARMGEGADLAAALAQVVDAAATNHPQREIRFETALQRPVPCDARRVAQLLDNLLGNALRHGAADQPVEVRADSDEARFELCVHNGGTSIPQATLDTMFEPFSRGQGGGAGHAPDRAQDPGLGLGLYIAAEIAKAHHGTLTVVSDESRGTRFLFRMPLR